jgi:hypothetical protein
VSRGRGVATRRRGARARLARVRVAEPLFEHDFLQKNCTEVNQVNNRKVVDLTTLYHFQKGQMGFFSKDFEEKACQL